MKISINSDTEQVKIIREALKANQGYCPCIVNSIGKLEYKCPCQDFRENIPVGSECHCGLYIKTEQ